MLYSGSLLKMNTQLKSTVEYELPIGNQLVELNQFLGKYVKFKWNNDIYCIICGRKTNKSFAQGYCYPCFISRPEVSECILRPELCEAHKGRARDMEWAENNCLQLHYVYLAVSSNYKVGVTRSSQIPTRLIDQVLKESIEASGRKPCEDTSLSEGSLLKKNIEMCESIGKYNRYSRKIKKCFLLKDNRLT